MIDFSTLQCLSIPDGVVTQIADASGRVLWTLSAATNEPAAIFEVAKQVSNTYAGETTYENEEFILIDIYPKKFGTVKVTYGGLTKTIVDTSGAEEPNAQKVYFGTLYGVADSVATPASGRLTIEGAYRGYGGATFTSGSGKAALGFAYPVKRIIDFGNPVYIGARMFYGYSHAITSLPNGIATIGAYAFYNCTNLALTSLPSGLASIGEYAFYGCTNLALTSLSSGLKSIGSYAFRYCSSLALSVIPEGVTTIGDYAFAMKNRSETAMRYGSITLPSSLTSIGQDAFAIPREDEAPYDDLVYSYLSEVILLATTPPAIPDSNVFGSAANIYYQNGEAGRVVVPAGCMETYKAAENWLRYMDMRGVEAS